VTWLNSLLSLIETLAAQSGIIFGFEVERLRPAPSQGISYVRLNIAYCAAAHCLCRAQSIERGTYSLAGRTYRQPGHGEYPPTGPENGDVPRKLHDMFLWP
jgi:hypothetical protein